MTDPANPPLEEVLDQLHDAHWRAFNAQLEVHRLATELRATYGASWTLIGRAIGISRQAAQQRFRNPPPGSLF